MFFHCNDKLSGIKGRAELGVGLCLGMWAECSGIQTRQAQKREAEDLRRKQTTGGNLHLLFTLQSESCMLCPCLVAPNSLCGDEDTGNQRKHFSFSVSHPPFIPSFPLSHKGCDHYKCHADRWELSITPLELGFVGFVATQFTVLLKGGWAKQAAVQLDQLIGWEGNKMQAEKYLSAIA